jgi:hypothetical protein
MNTLIFRVLQKKQKNFGFIKFLNGIRMIGGNETGVLIHQQKYVKGDWVNSLNEDDLGIEYHYDWRLNESGP